MAVTLGSTGITFPDATTQTTAATSSAPAYRNVTTTTTDITLTNADGGAFLTVTSTATVKINLPAANTFTGSRTITLKNIGTFAMLVYDNAGNYLFPLVANQGVICWASVATTAAGTWTIEDPVPDFIGSQGVIGNSAAVSAYTYNTTAPLSSTQQLTVYSAAGSLYGIVSTNTSGVLAFGAPQTLVSGGVGDFSGVAGLSGSLGVAWYGVSGTSDIRAIAFTVSGTTLTPGSSVAIASSVQMVINNNSTPQILMMSATTAVVVYHASNSLTGNILSVSGTTVTVGTASTLNTFVTSYPSGLCVLSATLFMVSYYNNSGTLGVFAKTCSVSGTTITPNAESSSISGGGNYAWISRLTTLSSTLAVIAYYPSSAQITSLRPLSISGTTVLLGNETQRANFSRWALCGTASNAGVFASTSGASVISCTGFTVSYPSMTFGTTTTMSSLITSTDVYMWNVTPFQTPSPTPSNTFVNVVAFYDTSFQQPLGVSGTTLTNSYSAYPAVPYSPAQQYYVTTPVATLSSTRAIVLATDAVVGGGLKWTAFLMDTSTTTPTYLSKVSVGEGFVQYSSYASICALSSTTAIILYNNVNVDGTQKAVLVTMAGSSLSIGAVASVNAATTVRQSSVSALSATTAIAFYDKSSGVQVANVLTVSGTSITVGAEFTAGTVSGFPDVSVVGLSSTTAMTSSQVGKVNVLSIAGTTITSSTGGVKSVTVTGSGAMYLSAINSTTVLAVSAVSSQYLTALVLTITGGGTNVSFGPAGFSYNSQSIGTYQPIMVSPTRGYVFVPGTSSQNSMYVPITINGDIPTYGPFLTVNGILFGALGTFAIAAPSYARLLAAGNNQSTGNFGASQIFTIGASN